MYSDLLKLPGFNVGSVLRLDWSAGQLWWFVFPVVIALAVLLFSYDIDRGLLRTYMLSQVSQTKLFIGKLTAMFVAVYVPLLVSGALILALADPALFLADPLFVWSHLWLVLLGWALMMYVMIGFSVFAAVTLKKPIYAFITPYVVIYALPSVPFPVDVRLYIPPESFIDLYYINPFGQDAQDIFRLFWSYAWPSIAIATALLALAYVLFIRMEQP
jgi:hypothetical protein